MDAQSERAAEPDIEALRVAYGHLRSDSLRAMAEFETLANSGSLMSLVYIGQMYEEGNGVEVSLTTAGQFYERAFVRGSVSGAFSLGRISWKREDYKRAGEYFTWGIEKNDPRAMYWLAELYLRGYVAQECRFNAAVALLGHASSLGHLQSARRLARIFMAGRFGIAKFFHGLRLHVWVAITAAKLAADEPWSDQLLDLPARMSRPIIALKRRR